MRLCASTKSALTLLPALILGQSTVHYISARVAEG